MKLATVGTSNITRLFLSAVSKVEDMALTAVYSRSEEKAIDFMKEHGAKAYFTDLSEMAQSDLFDSVYIASPNRFHASQSRLFLEHGKNVLCEKPMTTTKAEEEALYALAKDRGLIYAEAIMSIHTPAFQRLREELKTIGTIRTVTLNFCQLSSKYPAYLRGEKPNIFNPEMHAGCLMDIGVYNIYLAAALFGKPEKILSDAVFLDAGADAAGSAILKYNGFSVNLIYSKVAGSRVPSEILGDQGNIRIESVSQLTGIQKITEEKSVCLAPSVISRDEIMGAEARFFRDTVKNGDSDAYAFAKKTSLLVREITDEIRRQNGFPF